MGVQLDGSRLTRSSPSGRASSLLTQPRAEVVEVPEEDLGARRHHSGGLGERQAHEASLPHHTDARAGTAIAPRVADTGYVIARDASAPAA
jgi:hypothetical protein